MLKEWDQSRLDNVHALVLGVGGIGCTAAMDLVRLGVRKITILD